jgi:hypothetical protein
MYDQQVLLHEGLGLQKGVTKALVDTNISTWRRQMHAARLAEIGSAAAAVLSLNPSIQSNFLEGSMSILPDALQQALWREHFVKFTLPTELQDHGDQTDSSTSTKMTADRTEDSSSNRDRSSHSRSGSSREQNSKLLGHSVLYTTRALGLRPTHECGGHGLNMHGDLANRKLYMLEPSDVVQAREEQRRESAQREVPSSADNSSDSTTHPRSRDAMHASHALHPDVKADEEMTPQARELCEALKKWAAARQRNPCMLIVFGTCGDLLANENHAVGPTPSLRLLQHQLYESNSLAGGVPSLVIDIGTWMQLSPQQRIDRMHAALMHTMAPKSMQRGGLCRSKEWATPVRLRLPISLLFLSSPLFRLPL